MSHRPEFEAALDVFLAARRVLERPRPAPLGSLEDALGWDAWGRARADEILPALAGFR